MKKFALSFLAFALLISFTSCGSKAPEPQGDPALLNAAKNSQQAKDAEAAVNDAAAKAKANADAALKQIEQENSHD